MLEKLTIDYNRQSEGELRPYTEEEILATLVRENFNGMDILEKTKPRSANERRVIACEASPEGHEKNTKLSVYRLDEDGDMDDASIEIFYYNRLDVKKLPARKNNVYPPMMGDNFDVPVGTTLSQEYIALLLKDLFFIEFKPEHLSGDFQVKQKPFTEVEVTITGHILVTGTVKLIIASPEDTRPLMELDLGEVTPVGTRTAITIDQFNQQPLRAPNLIEMRLIRESWRLPLYLGA